MTPPSTPRPADRPTIRADRPRRHRDDDHRFELLATMVREGVWDWDLSTGRVAFSPRCLELLGLQSVEAPRTIHDWLDRVHPDDRIGLKNWLDACPQSNVTQATTCHRIVTPDGLERYVDVVARRLTDADHQTVAVMGTMTDVTKHRLVEQRLLFQTYHDPLTGLFNRTSLISGIDQELDRAAEGRSNKVAVLAINMDRFHQINNAFGQSAGDSFLMAIAERIRRHAGASTIIGRWSADEFVVVLSPAPSEQQLVGWASRLESLLAEPLEMARTTIFPTVRIGIAVARPGESTSEEIIERAIQSTRPAFDDDVPRIRIDSPQQSRERWSLLERESDLRRAIDQEQFVLRFQPIVHGNSGTLAGFESLVRWEHPTLGPIDPAEFIPLAEATNLIVPLGEWILRTSVQQLRDWQCRYSPAGPVTLNVNLSRRQLADPGLVPLIRELLSAGSIRSGSLRIEITETLTMTDVARARRVFDELRSLGARIVIDDFGTGHSSLASLPDLPVDALKIDRSFIASMLENAGSTEVVRLIVALAKSLDLDVTAEGVERPDQWTLLRDLGCDYLQGYLFSPPVDRMAAEQMLIIRSQSSQVTAPTGQDSPTNRPCW